ncbi:unnamed protein product [Rotaria sp. Silwood2]|nr:unnamed protein product [Rotaria sp. Silwood2]
MLFAFQSSQKKSSFNETDDQPLQTNSKISFETKSTQRFNGKTNKQEKSFNDNDNILKRTSQMESAHDGFIQRLLRDEASTRRRQQRQRQRSYASSSNNLYDIDRTLQDENDDWFFEKILEKFENIRSNRTDRYIRSRSNGFNNYGVERIIERRYYVKKLKEMPKCNQITSTDDLKEFTKRNRQLSGISSVATTTATSYSQCSSSTPTFIENIRNQSNLLRDEISELKDDIEQLQTSQQEFFQQLKVQLQPNINSTIKSENIVRPIVVSPKQSLEKKSLFSNVPVPSTDDKRSRSISTVSIASSSSRATTVNSELTPNSANKSTRAISLNFLFNVAVFFFLKPLAVNVAPIQSISEFIATKNSSIPPAPPVNANVNSKYSSTASTLSISEFSVTKTSSIKSPPPVNTYQGSKRSSTTTNNGSKLTSIASTPPVNARVDSKSSSTSSTPQIFELIKTKSPSIKSPPPVNTYQDSKRSSTTTNNGSKLTSIASSSPVNARDDLKPSSTTSTPRISAFVETKNSSIQSSVPPVNTYIDSKPPSVPPSTTIYSGSKLSSIASTSPVNVRVDSKSSSTTSTPQISEFVETKNPAFVSKLIVNTNVSSKPPSVPTTSNVNTYVNSKISSITSTPPPTSTYIGLTSSSIAPRLPVNTYVDIKPRSVSSTPSVSDSVEIKKPLFVSTSTTNTYVNSKPPSIPRTPPLNTYANSRPSSTPSANEYIAPESSLIETGSAYFKPSSLTSNSPAPFRSISSAQGPVYENELEHRRTLSPRSQIVASSASINESSDSSVGWSSPEVHHSDNRILSEVPRTKLQNHDLQALVQYSSQLELSGFPPSITHVIADPNTSSTFWDSVDQFIENYRLTTTDIELSPLQRAMNGSNRYVFNDSTTRQLDKYDLEIKPREIIESSAPLLMPPLDIS